MKTAKLSPLCLSVLSVVLGAAASGCGLSQVQADIPDVVVTEHNLGFQGVPISALIGDVSVSRSFSQQHAKLDLPAGLDPEVKALGLTLVAKTGIQDFSFLHNLRVSMSDNVHPPVVLIEYQQAAGAKPSPTLDLVSANPVNTLDSWKTDSATFTVDVAGTLPPQDWAVDLLIHFGGSLKYHL